MGGVQSSSSADVMVALFHETASPIDLSAQDERLGLGGFVRLQHLVDRLEGLSELIAVHMADGLEDEDLLVVLGVLQRLIEERPRSEVLGLPGHLHRLEHALLAF